MMLNFLIMINLRINNLHTDFIGIVCKLTRVGVQLEKEYETIFEIGNYELVKFLFEFDTLFIFIDQPPVVLNGNTWFCLKEIGNDDLHWFTLMQIMVCS